jgi:hypothetical protein
MCDKNSNQFLCSERGKEIQTSVVPSSVKYPANRYSTHTKQKDLEGAENDVSVKSFRTLHFMIKG